MTSSSIQQKFQSVRSPLLQEMEQFAEQHHIPIMDEETIEPFLTLLRLQRPQAILELGSAIGYSAIRIAEQLPKATITTIERDKERYEQAVQYIQRANLQNRITIHHADALLFDQLSSTNQFDALFIDAAKGQYQRFFERYEPHVVTGGVIYCDNLFLRGLSCVPLEEVPRRKRTMVRNLHTFTDWLLEQPNLEVSLLPLGDGLCVIRKGIL